MTTYLVIAAIITTFGLLTEPSNKDKQLDAIRKIEKSVNWDKFLKLNYRYWGGFRYQSSMYDLTKERIIKIGAII